MRSLFADVSVSFPQVCQVTTAESAEFTGGQLHTQAANSSFRWLPLFMRSFLLASRMYSGLLFEPQPYSISTRHGMPQEMEHYHFDPSYAIVTVPATIMFKAKCLSPSRLCAVFKVSEPVCVSTHRRGGERASD